jgi:hypothetical protein
MMTTDFEPKIGKTYYVRPPFSTQVVTAEIITFKRNLFGIKKWRVEYGVRDGFRYFKTQRWVRRSQILPGR